MEVPTFTYCPADSISDSDSSYDDRNSMERLTLRNQEYSDDRSMQRRNPIRRQRNVLDDDQTRDAMKLLEKYVRKKYRHSMIYSQDIPDIEQSTTPVGHTQSACQFSRQLTPAERLSHVFNSTPLGPMPAELHYAPPLSPQFHETTFRSEIKLKERESWGSWFIRVVKFLYQFLGLQYIILAVLILGYACLGGYIFQTLEYENQLMDLEKERLDKIEESKMLAQNLLNYMKRWNCGQSNEDKCLELITKAFIERSDKVEVNIRGEGWRWDFWNSVFFAATIFTTIGYGNLACKTATGRIVTIIYGLVGIPFMLFVLKVYGEMAIKWVQKIRYLLKKCGRRCVKRCTRNGMKKAGTIESVASDDLIDEGSEEEERITTFPVKWALFIVFLFMVVCSFIVSFWEKWDFLTAFYFFFVSLSTIGFGDVIPEHPRTACGLFILYFVGLALFSMVYAILQERVENQYMWALELIDQEYQENQEKLEQQIENEDVALDKPSWFPENALGGNGNGNGNGNAFGKMHSQNSVRWRQKQSAYSMENVPDRPVSERRFSVFTPGEAPQAPPPVLAMFMLHNLSMKKKLLARSESILQGAKRPSTLFPSNEMLSTSANSSRGSPWPHAADMNHPPEPTALGKRGTAGISAPNLTISGGNRSPSAALSVITEASDEDTRHFKKHRKYMAKTVETDETASHHGSAESLDQVMDELQLEANDQAITPKPYRDPAAGPRFRKRDEALASRAEKLPLSPKEPLAEEDEEDKDDKDDTML